MTRTFAVSFDYLCPWARNAHEHLVTALRAGADWDVTWIPYSLQQGHVEEGEPPIWERDDPNEFSGILALQAGLAVRDHLPERFLDTHLALFAARHEHGHDTRDPEVVRAALVEGGVDPDEILGIVAGGGPLKTLREEHEAGVRDHTIWGVPTFVGAERAVFIRILDRPQGDAEVARQRIEQIMDLVDGTPQLHEFKQTTLKR